MKRRNLLSAGLAGAVAAAGVCAQAPSASAITLVAPFAAGGQIDAAARKYARLLSSVLQRPVLVENKPGAGGVLAAQHVLRSRPDGTTLLVTSSSFLIGPHVYRTAGYSPFSDFAEVSGLYSSSAVLVGSAASKANSAAEFIAQARKEPRKYSYSTNGAGTFSHLLMEKFMADAGIELVHVPYKSAPEASQAVIQNLVEAAIDTPFSAAPRARAGQLRALLIFGDARESTLPGVPTAAEAGFAEAGKLNILTGIVASSKTPPDIVATLVQASSSAVSDPGYGSELRAMGMQPVTMPVASLRQAMREQERFFAGVLEKLKMPMTQ